jgi:hypothetical protein
MRLDAQEETGFTRLIHGHYRHAENRSADYHQYRWHHRKLDYEGRWRITNRLEVAHATQVRDGDSWSLVDIVAYTMLLLRVGAKWWEKFNYFGDGVLVADLNVSSQPIQRATSRQFMKLFGPAEGDGKRLREKKRKKR